MPRATVVQVSSMQNSLHLFLGWVCRAYLVSRGIGLTLQEDLGMPAMAVLTELLELLLRCLWQQRRRRARPLLDLEPPVPLPAAPATPPVLPVSEPETPYLGEPEAETPQPELQEPATPYVAREALLARLEHLRGPALEPAVEERSLALVLARPALQHAVEVEQGSLLLLRARPALEHAEVERSLPLLALPAPEPERSESSGQSDSDYSEPVERPCKRARLAQELRSFMDARGCDCSEPGPARRLCLYGARGLVPADAVQLRERFATLCYKCKLEANKVARRRLAAASSDSSS